MATGPTPNMLCGPQTEFGGPVRAAFGEYDGKLWIPNVAWQSYIPPNGQVPSPQISMIRLGPGDWAVFRAATAISILGACLNSYILEKWGSDPMRSGHNFGQVPDFPQQNPAPVAGTQLYSAPANYPFGVGHNFRGFQICGFDIAYMITAADLDSFTFAFYRRQLADNQVDFVTSDPGAPYTTNGVPGTNALPATARAMPYVVRVNFNTPYIIGNNQETADDMIELTVADQRATANLFILGVGLLCNYNIL